MGQLLKALSGYWDKIQGTLFSVLEEELDPLTKKQQQLITIFELVRVEQFIPNYSGYEGRLLKTRAAIARSFIAKMTYNMETTSGLIERLKTDSNLRMICGWETLTQLPSESTFSRAFADFSGTELPQRVLKTLVEENLKNEIIQHNSRDSTAIEAMEKPKSKTREKSEDTSPENRLVKELRLNSISTIEEANPFLPSFMEKYNQRFAKTPKSPLNAHRELPKDVNLDRVFRLQETRYLSKNLTFQYKKKLYQMKTSRPIYALSKAKINILESKEGDVLVEYKNKKLLYSIYEERPLQAEEVHSKEINLKLDNLLKKKYKSSKRHPWKRPLPSIAINC